MSHILDISRFISRAHLPFDTGIDRVERAFILDTLQRFENAHFIARIGNWFAILDVSGMQHFLHLEGNQNWPRSNGMDTFRLKLVKPQRRMRSALRNIAIAYTKIEHLQTEISGLGLGVFDYTNVGHSNLSVLFLETMRSAGVKKISAFVHDVIPLDFPQYCRSDRLKPFAQNMQNIMTHCDQIYCNSKYTADRISAHFDQTPVIRIVHLANHTPTPSIKDTPQNFDRPTFAMLGTIEPRKNIIFILDVWEKLSVKMPPEVVPNLIIIGKRGWEEADTLYRLDRAKYVAELNDLTDLEVQSHLKACTALLFPSHVEGYGLPAQEAMALGVPVIASDIPVFQELFSERATLLPIADAIIWTEFIENMLLNPKKTLANADYCTKTNTWEDFFADLYKNLDGE